MDELFIGPPDRLTIRVIKSLDGDVLTVRNVTRKVKFGLKTKWFKVLYYVLSMRFRGNLTSSYKIQLKPYRKPVIVEYFRFRGREVIDLLNEFLDLKNVENVVKTINIYSFRRLRKMSRVIANAIIRFICGELDVYFPDTDRRVTVKPTLVKDVDFKNEVKIEVDLWSKSMEVKRLECYLTTCIEVETVAKSWIDRSDIELIKSYVKQRNLRGLDEFLVRLTHVLTS